MQRLTPRVSHECTFFAAFNCCMIPEPRMCDYIVRGEERCKSVIIDVCHMKTWALTVNCYCTI